METGTLCGIVKRPIKKCYLLNCNESDLPFAYLIRIKIFFKFCLYLIKHVVIFNIYNSLFTTERVLWWRRNRKKERVCETRVELIKLTKRKTITNVHNRTLCDPRFDVENYSRPLDKLLFLVLTNDINSIIFYFNMIT